MKQEALESEVGNDWVPYEKKTRGKVWKSKERKRDAAPMLPDELSDVLDDASEEDLLELAGWFQFFVLLFAAVCFVCCVLLLTFASVLLFFAVAGLPSSFCMVISALTSFATML